MSSRPCSPAAAPPLEDDNLLSEILLRLPPQPSSLPRASSVSKRWCSLVSDPRFVRRFRIHHRRNPPLLGFFHYFNFVPIMDPPNRVPEGRFSFQIEEDDGNGQYPPTLGCRHGLVLVFQSENKLLVWDPVNRNKHRLAVPPWFEAQTSSTNGAVIRAAGDIQHFQVVLVRMQTNQQQHTRATVQFYSSETGIWGDLISTTLPSSMDQLTTRVDTYVPSVRVGNSLYWLLTDSPSLFDGVWSGMLEFDLDRQRPNVIPLPVDISAKRFCQFSVMQADGGGLGFLLLSQSDFGAQLWKRNTNCDGIASWVLGKTIELGKLLPLDLEHTGHLMILGYAEDNNMVLLQTFNDLFIVHLESLQFRKLEIPEAFRYYPFESVYTAGMGIDHGNDGAELLHNI